MYIDIITIFPEMFALLNYGVIGRAQKKQLLTLKAWNLRDFADNKYRRVDERPYGGGPGMVMMYEPLKKAIATAKKAAETKTKVIYLSPQGKTIKQDDLKKIVEAPSPLHLIFIAGRYEGIDERLIENEIDEEWSIGDYILSGGELAALVLIDAMTRLLPGTLGDEDSAAQDSFSDGLLDYPHYTRPEEVDGKKVPEILLSGDHKKIASWRLKQALGRTWLRRQDLLEKRKLNKQEKKLLDEFILEQKNKI